MIKRIRSAILRTVRNVLILTAVVLASVAACSAGVDSDDYLAEYGNPEPVSGQAATELIARGATTLQDLSDDGTLRVTINEVEARSALAVGLRLDELARVMRSLSPERVREASGIEDVLDLFAERVAASEAATNRQTWRGRIRAVLDPHVEDAQVRFLGSGDVAVAGSLAVWRLRQPALLVVAPTVDEGSLQLEFSKARLGRIPAPRWVFNRLGPVLASAFVLGSDYAKLTEISVSDGELTVAATIE